MELRDATMYKINSKNLLYSIISFNSLYNGKESQKKTYLKLTQFVHLKLTQYCESAILQFSFLKNVHLV